MEINTNNFSNVGFFSKIKDVQGLHPNIFERSSERKVPAREMHV